MVWVSDFMVIDYVDGLYEGIDDDWVCEFEIVLFEVFGYVFV